MQNGLQTLHFHTRSFEPYDVSIVPYIKNIRQIIICFPISTYSGCLFCLIINAQSSHGMNHFHILMHNTHLFWNIKGRKRFSESSQDIMYIMLLCS